MLDHLLGRTEASGCDSATSVHQTSPPKVINGAVLDMKTKIRFVAGIVGILNCGHAVNRRRVPVWMTNMRLRHHMVPLSIE